MFFSGITFACQFNIMNNHTRSAGQQGFSLIEIVMVISILVILSAVALPFFGGFIDNRNLKTAARDIAGNIFETRERAISEDRVYQITFNVGGNSYVIQQCLQSNDQSCASGFNAVPFLSMSPSAFGNGIKLTGTTFAGNVIKLQASGTLNNGVNGVITLTNKRGSQATIRTTATGRTYVDWTGTLQ
jgi:prepilin-type N-terminal cleavage/methylation domain-containing protein